MNQINSDQLPKMLMRIAWGITGAAFLLKESFQVMSQLRSQGNLITSFISNAGWELIRMFGLHHELSKICPGGFLQEIFLESAQSHSFPKAARVFLGRYDLVIISPLSSNSLAKIAHGICDSLVTNLAGFSLKSGMNLYLVPTDSPHPIETHTPYLIRRELCNCIECPPAQHCHAIKGGQIQLLECNGCGECIKLCPKSAISRIKIKLRSRWVDLRNLELISEMPGVILLSHPRELLSVISTQR